MIQTDSPSNSPAININTSASSSTIQNDSPLTSPAIDLNTLASSSTVHVLESPAVVVMEPSKSKRGRPEVIKKEPDDEVQIPVLESPTELALKPPNCKRGRPQVIKEVEDRELNHNLVKTRKLSSGAA